MLFHLKVVELIFNVAGIDNVRTCVSLCERQPIVVDIRDVALILYVARAFLADRGGHLHFCNATRVRLAQRVLETDILGARDSGVQRRFNFLLSHQ